jgi:hypothetical protein
MKWTKSFLTYKGTSNIWIQVCQSKFIFKYIIWRWNFREFIIFFQKCVDPFKIKGRFKFEFVPEFVTWNPEWIWSWANNESCFLCFKLSPCEGWWILVIEKVTFSNFKVWTFENIWLFKRQSRAHLSPTRGRITECLGQLMCAWPHCHGPGHCAFSVRTTMPDHRLATAHGHERRCVLLHSVRLRREGKTHCPHCSSPWALDALLALRCPTFVLHASLLTVRVHPSHRRLGPLSRPSAEHRAMSVSSILRASATSRTDSHRAPRSTKCHWVLPPLECLLIAGCLRLSSSPAATTTRSPPTHCPSTACQPAPSASGPCHVNRRHRPLVHAITIVLLHPSTVAMEGPYQWAPRPHCPKINSSCRRAAPRLVPASPHRRAPP